MCDVVTVLLIVAMEPYAYEIKTIKASAGSDKHFFPLEDITVIIIFIPRVLGLGLKQLLLSF